MNHKSSERKPLPKGSDGAATGEQRRGGEDFLIVAIGASAGGIEATTELMSNLATDTGMAFVVVQHLDPKHQSILAELLSKKTAMPVTEVTDGVKIRRNHVYVIPPNAVMSISDHTLLLKPRDEGLVMHMAVDHFMRSLAEGQGRRAVGVILSGSGTDGTLGMAEIQAQGGVTFAQDDVTAKYDGMPRSAVAAGRVDYVLPPKGIALELARLARHPYVGRDGEAAASPATAESAGLNSIFQLLRRSTGVDFSHYRQTTILRRIQRRMVVHKVDRLEEYVKYVQTNPAEIKALYQDILINVTSFFRNPKMFEALKAEIFPEVTKHRNPESTIRVWTPGCASGEETYSVAITLLEFLGDKVSQTPIQFFGTDVSDSSIAKARAGVYPENIQGDVSPERLRRFFTKVDGGYRISKSIRDMCIFTQHNVLNDPPFSQMDLICCRNLLIYLEPVLQNKVIALFHYATRSGGYLALGTSEGIGTGTGLFTMVDRTQKLFVKKMTGVRQPVTFSLNHSGDHAGFGAMRIPAKQTESAWHYLEAQKEFDRRLLSQYSPATVFVNEDLEITHTRGDVSRYLKLAPGRASLSILKMAREGMLLDLRNALSKSKKEGAPVRRDNVRMKSGNGEPEERGSQRRHSERVIRFEVVPMSVGELKELYFMIVFQDERSEPLRPRDAQRGKMERESEASSARIAKLEQELAATKEYLQSVIETQEATNEELQSANEEILSSNEELQSTNEELETAKEELQSANEELTTVNDELRNRNVEVTQGNTDLTNLFGSIDIAVLTVGSDLTIQRFTPEAQKYLGLIPADVGRPLRDINPIIEIPNFQALVSEVMSTLRPVERQLKDKKGGSCQLRILPYRMAGQKIDGVVITIVALASQVTASA